MRGGNRKGFTLLELMVVLALLALTAAAAIPALLGARTISPTHRVAMEVEALLTEARDAARANGTTASFMLAPAEGRYWLTRGDSTATGAITLASGVRFESTQSRVLCRFTATTQADACTIIVRGDVIDTVRVDPWSGEVRRSETRP